MQCITFRSAMQIEGEIIHMWDRTILKSNAKTALTGKYATAYLVCLVAALISGVISMIQNWVVKPINMVDFFSEPDSYRLTELGELMQRATISSSFSLGNLLLFIFVVLPITVGVARFFVHNRFGDTKFETMFSGFRENYGNTVGAMFVTYLFVFLWTLLLVIPGIIKALENSMVEFLLSDNPSMPGERARQISSQMTSGEKGAIFVFYLSFLGWYILGGLPSAFSTISTDSFPFRLPPSSCRLLWLTRKRLWRNFISSCATAPFAAASCSRRNLALRARPAEKERRALLFAVSPKS